jgi:lambda repressor-like predicted transcriptional regulator
VPRKGPAYPIDKEWRDRVNAELATRGWSRAELARQAGCSRTSITEALDTGSTQSTLVPSIHKALSWDPPMMPLLSPDAEEIVGIMARLDPQQRGRLLERARVLEEERRGKKQ